MSEPGPISDLIGKPEKVKELLAKQPAEASPPFLPSGRKNQSDTVTGEPQSKSGKIILTDLSKVTPRQVQWLWRGYIPLGKLTLLDGDPGLGKSLLTLDLAARVSVGRTMPEGGGGDLQEPAGVLLLSVEDDLSDTIRPRLDSAGGDPAKVVHLTGVEKKEGIDFPTLGDIDFLREAVRSAKAKLVVIDPLMAFLSSFTDSHKDQDIRRALSPLAALAAETESAILVVRHLNKTSSVNPLYRGGGSIGIIGAVRSGLLVAPDPDDPKGKRRILAPTKSNLAELPPALVYRIRGSKENIPRIVWEGVSPKTASSLLSIESVLSAPRSQGVPAGRARFWSCPCD